MRDLSGYIKIETHCHTNPLSLCARFSPKEVVEMYSSCGYGAIVLTNHYSTDHLKRYGEDKKDVLGAYLSAYRDMVKESKGTGLKVFLGAEVKFSCAENAPNDKGEFHPVNAEFLLYGVSEKFLFDTYNLTALEQKELYNICKSENVLCVQSHPYRIEHCCKPLDPNFMDGVEIYNPHFPSRFDKTFEFAKNNRLLMTGGSDFHVFDDLGNAGMYIPKDISSQFEFRDYLKSGECLIFDKEGLFFENSVKLRKEVK